MPILIVHLLAVTAKLVLFPFVPRLRDVKSVRAFYTWYRPLDRISNWVLWITGFLLVAVTSWRLLLQMWLLLSILLYIVVFLAIRMVLVRRLKLIADSQKVLAHDELKLFRVETACVVVVVLGLLGAIGYMMVNKP
ncbi:MAG: DUF2269 family protein [Firmicutes bacterium]|nr:DUF2269 family protein [Bacillota bacterium]